jgi:hypothetical protein
MSFLQKNPISVKHSASNNPEANMEVPLPPPPPVVLATMLDHQNRILEFVANDVMS